MRTKVRTEISGECGAPRPRAQTQLQLKRSHHGFVESSTKYTVSYGFYKIVFAGEGKSERELLNSFILSLFPLTLA